MEIKVRAFEQFYIPSLKKFDKDEALKKLDGEVNKLGKIVVLFCRDEEYPGSENIPPIIKRTVIYRDASQSTG